MSFSTILFTEKGRALQAKAMSGATLNFTKMAMGSGSLGGQSQVALTNLIEPKVTLAISKISRGSNYALVQGNFKNTDISTGFYWREIGVFAQDPDIGEILYCYGNAGTLAEYIPPQTAEIIEKVVNITAIVGDAANVTATLDTSVYATKAEVEEARNKADQAFQLASNGKNLIKNAITGVDSEVNVPEDATFQQLADAIAQIETGIDTSDATATATQILAGMTAYVKDAKVTGTMPNRGAVNQVLGINGNYTIPQGYHDGAGKVTQALTTKSASTITPGTTDQIIAANQYLTGVQTIKGDANLLPANILLGKSIFGVAGNAIVGKRWASGEAVATHLATSGKVFMLWNGANFAFDPCIEISLPFEAGYIIAVTREDNNNDITVVYDTSWSNRYPKLFKMALYSFQGDAGSYYHMIKADTASAYVNSTGFCLPTKYGDYTFRWFAVEK